MFRIISLITLSSVSLLVEDRQLVSHFGGDLQEYRLGLLEFVAEVLQMILELGTQFRVFPGDQQQIEGPDTLR